MDQILPWRQKTPLLHRHVTSHLYHPCFIGMRRDTSHRNLTTAQMQEKQDIIGHEPAQGPDLSGEEVRRHEDVHVRADKLLPRRGRLALRGRRDAMALEDVAHRLRTDRHAQIGEGADDPVIAPGAILLGYAYNQRFELL